MHKGIFTTDIVKWIISRVKIIICNFTRHFQLNVIWSQRKYTTMGWRETATTLYAKEFHSIWQVWTRNNNNSSATAVAAKEETIAMWAKVVDEALYATPAAIHYLFAASSAIQSVGQSVSQPAYSSQPHFNSVKIIWSSIHAWHAIAYEIK